MKTLIIALIGTVSSTAALARSPVLESAVRSTVHDSLPGATPRQNAGINYPVPGTVTANAVQFCGDGDVANFAAAHPAWNHQEGGAIDFTVGYWIQEPGAANSDIPTPDLANYFSVGTGNMTIGGAAVTTMAPSTLGGAGTVPILPTLNSAVGNLLSLHSYSMPAASGATSEQMHLFVGMMMCKTVRNAARVTHDPLKVSQAFANFTSASFYNSIATALGHDFASSGVPSWSSSEAQGMKIHVVPNSDSVQLQMGGGGIASAAVGSDRFAQLAHNLYDLQMPPPPTNTNTNTSTSTSTGTAVAVTMPPLQDVVGNDPAITAITALAAEIGSGGKTTCGAVSGVSHAGKYPWEPYALQLTCATLDRGPQGTLSAILAAFLQQPQPADQVSFNQLKSPLISSLLAASLMQGLEDAFLGTGDALPQQSCIQPPHYIDNVMGSIVMRAYPSGVQNVTQNPADTHPESYFAVGGYNAYYNGVAGDRYTIFNMTSPAADDSYSALLTRGSPQSAASVNLPAAVVMQFNVRGVGCGTNVYCLNDR